VTAAPFLLALADGPPGGHAVWLHANDGIRLRAGFWPGGRKGTVLLLPGRTEYIEKYGRAANDLARRGYATLAIDFRGQGLADRPLADVMMGHVAAFGDYQRDLQALLALTQQMDVPQPLYLLSHSMGGSIALRALMDGYPVKAAAFSAPMWGIKLPPLMRPFAPAIAWLGTALGKSQTYAPTTGPRTYVLANTFKGNVLTTDPDMWAYMQAHVQADPRLSLGGPSLHWLRVALADCAALARMPSPNVPCYTALGTQEHVVATAPIHARMARWPGATFDIITGAEHEVMMERPATRAQFFDAACALFDAHR
jgi:lysophospholipase